MVLNVRVRPARWIGVSLALLLPLSSCMIQKEADLAGAPRPRPGSAMTLEQACTVQAVQALAPGLSTKIGLTQLAKATVSGPFLPGGVKYTAASASLPAYCQITATFVTDPKTGSTAHFLATLPANWNGRYLQIGCSGHCGSFAVSDAASRTITISNQGKPEDIIARGFASFATDEGHAGFEAGRWAVKGPGQINEATVDDFLYRSHKVLSRLGKEFTGAFYRQKNGTPARIQHSYFTGCSGGGRDALVAASYFPEEFDGIIAGSPYANLVGKAFQVLGLSLATVRSADAQVSPDQMAQVRSIVMAQCDATDGVKDNLIQNPMACNFRPERDLPRCTGDKPGVQCFTRAQAETVSTLLTAVTDQNGSIVQPGYSASETQNALLTAPNNPGAATPWNDSGDPRGGVTVLGDAVLRVFAHKNDPNFRFGSIVSYGPGGKGPATNFHIIIPAAEAAFAQKALRMGIGSFPENATKLIRLNRKLLIWSNLSDQLLTPYMAVNYYKTLAARNGGYDKLQRNVRLFGIPGTSHCSMGGVANAPGNFDALQAMVDWVEKGRAPNALLATTAGQPKGRTMPLCAFPAMARYSGRGDVKDAANWSCPATDKSMLIVGESGRQAGVL